MGLIFILNTPVRVMSEQMSTSDFDNLEPVKSVTYLSEDKHKIFGDLSNDDIEELLDEAFMLANKNDWDIEEMKNFILNNTNSELSFLEKAKLLTVQLETSGDSYSTQMYSLNGNYILRARDEIFLEKARESIIDYPIMSTYVPL